MKHVLFYEPGAVDEKAPLYADAHRDWYERFHERGSLLMIGPFSNAQEEGAMCVFTSREDAEEFANGDP
ncbi:MAG: YciI family protein, partial [Gaiellaceae bacterium]